ATRREFLVDSLLSTTAALLAANSPSWALTRYGEQTGRKVGANDVIRIACIGVHGRGAAHASAYAGMRDVEVAAICDVDSNVVGPSMDAVEKRGNPRPAYVQE